MTSKERVLLSLDHQQPDRVPLDLTQDEVFPKLESELRGHFMVKDMEAVRLALGVDLRWVQPVCRRLSEHPEQAGTNWFGTTDGLLSFADDVGARPLRDATTAAEVEQYPWPDPDWFDYGSVATLARQYSDYAVVAPRTWSPLFCRICELCGMERAMTLLYDHPAVIEAMVERIVEFHVRFLESALDAAPGQIDIMFTGDDPAGQDGMLLSVDTWRKFFKKPMGRIFAVAKDRNVRVMYHCCGSAVHLVPDLLDIGMDILQPVQCRAAGMDPAVLKAEFGRDLSFCGGVDIQYTLPCGTPDEVRAEVRALVDTMGRDGGYILAPSHTLMDDVPLANVLAMYDEARHDKKPRGRD